MIKYYDKHVNSNDTDKLSNKFSNINNSSNELYGPIKNLGSANNILDKYKGIIDNYLNIDIDFETSGDYTNNDNDNIKINDNIFISSLTPVISLKYKIKKNMKYNLSNIVKSISLASFIILLVKEDKLIISDKIKKDHLTNHVPISI